MAIYFQGMTKEELRLNRSMVKSGDEIDLSALKGLKSINIPPVELEIRQRSLAPLVASVGVPFRK